MQLEEYLQHYKAFYDEFLPGVGPPEKLEKLREEMLELLLAMCSENKADIISESIDVLNTTLAYLISEGVHDPLYAGARKLQANAALYRSGGKRIK